MPESDKLDPTISGVEVEDRAARYDRWFCDEVAASLADTRPDVPHDEAMARIRATITNAKKHFR